MDDGQQRLHRHRRAPRAGQGEAPRRAPQGRRRRGFAGELCAELGSHIACLFGLLRLLCCVAAAALVAGCHPYRPADLAAIAEPRLVVDAEQHLHWPELPSARAGVDAAADPSDEAAVIVDLSAYRELAPRAGGAANAAAWVRYFAERRGLAPAHLFTLRGADANPDTIRAAIQSAGALTGKRGRLWLIFIGHAATAQTSGRGLLLTYGAPAAAPLHPAHVIPLSSLGQEFLDWVAAPPIVVVDACGPPGLDLGEAIGGVEPRLHAAAWEPTITFYGSTPGGAKTEKDVGGAVEGPSRRGLRGAFISAGLGERCVDRLPGGDRSALSYWLLGALAGWGEGVAEGALGHRPWERRWFHRDGQVFAGEALDYTAALSHDVVDSQQAAPPGIRVLSRRRLRLSRDADGEAPTIAALVGDPERRSPLVFAGGARIRRPPPIAAWTELPAAARAEVEPLLRDAAAPLIDPHVLADRWCAAAEAPAEAAALRERECGRWRRYATRWRAFHVIVDYDHGLLGRYLDEAEGADAAAAMRGLLDAYVELPAHPRYVAVDAGLRAWAAGDARWRELAILGPSAAVDAGRYFRGCTDADANCENDETPQLRGLTRFAIDRREVSRRDYAHCRRAGACEAVDAGACYSWTGEGFAQGATLPAAFYADDAPQVCVTWGQAQAYCAWLGKRLPTELEWEVAARGSDRRIYPWGDAPPDCAAANHSECGRLPWPVDQVTSPEGAFGLLHMAGNVGEWVGDWYSDNHRFTRLRNPRGAPQGRLRVVRGGSFYDPPEYLRASYRYALTPTYGYATVGFRCVGR